MRGRAAAADAIHGGDGSGVCGCGGERLPTAAGSSRAREEAGEGREQACYRGNR